MNRTIGLKGGKGAPGSGSRPKGSVEKNAQVEMTDHTLSPHPDPEKARRGWLRCTCGADRYDGGMSSQPPRCPREGRIWKVENPEEVTLEQILTKWDEVLKEKK